MALLEILEFPDPRLRTIAMPVRVVDKSIQRLINDMFDTMYGAPGIGLAATQVNIHQQIIVIDVSENQNEPLVFINPSITITDSMPNEHKEGCLSVPGVFESITRPSRITVSALDGEGKTFEMAADGLLAVCLQHEMDHLNGKLFVDYLSGLKRQRIKKALEKQHKQQQFDC